MASALVTREGAWDAGGGAAFALKAAPARAGAKHPAASGLLAAARSGSVVMSRRSTLAGERAAPPSRVSFSSGPTPSPDFTRMPGEVPPQMPPRQSSGNPRYNSRGDVEEDAELYTFKAHSGAVYAVCFSADSRWLFSAGQDKTVRAWRMSDGQCMAVLRTHAAAVLSVAASPSPKGTFLATGDRKNQVVLWETRIDGGALRASKLWNADDGGGDAWSVPYLKHPSTRYGASYTTPGVNALAITPDDRLLCSGTARGTVTIFDTKAGKPYTVLLGHTGPVSCLAASNDSRYLFSGSGDTTAMVWDLDELGGKLVEIRKGSEKLVKRRIICTLRGHTAAVTAMSLSSDNRRLYTASSDGTVRAWMVVRTADGKHIQSDAEDDSLYLHGGSVGGSGTAQASGAACLRVSRGHCGQSVRALALSAAGGMSYGTLFSAGEDDAVKVWRAADGRWLRTLKGHEDWATTLALSQDNVLLASGAHDACVKVWRVGGIVSRESVAAATTVSAAQLVGGVG